MILSFIELDLPFVIAQHRAEVGSVGLVLSSILCT